MDRPTEHDTVLDTSSACSFFHELLRFLRGKFDTAVQRFFVEQAFPVLLYQNTVVDLFGKSDANVFFEIFFDDFLRFVFCLKV